VRVYVYVCVCVTPGEVYTLCVCGGGGVKQSLDSPRDFREVEASRFHRKIKVVRSAVRTDRLYPPGNIPGTHFCWRLSRPQGGRKAYVNEKFH